MRDTEYAPEEAARRRATKELILWFALLLLFLALFSGTIYFIAFREAVFKIQNRPRGLMLGWLTLITLSLFLSRASRRQEADLPKNIVLVREILQAFMLFFSFLLLSYASYSVHQARASIARRPLRLLIGWFALITLIAFFVKGSETIRRLRKK